MSEPGARHRLCVAPMMERTDRHCRYLLRLFAPRAWLYTEMVTAFALLHGDARRLLRFDESEHPVALQLGGADPAALAAAAALGERAGYDEINLNVGCPSARVKAGRFGAALMLDAGLVADCVTAMRDAVDVPVTVKTRIGVDESDSYAFLERFVARIAAAGCRSIFVHARKAWLSGLSPRQNREIPPLDYSRVYRLKVDFPELEVVINGGLGDRDDALRQLERVDGIMLGRRAYQNPPLLAELDEAIFGAPVPATADVLQRYWRYVRDEVDAGTPLNAMTRHLMGVRAGLAGGRRWRRELGELARDASGLDRLRQLIAGIATAGSSSSISRYNARV